MIHVHFTHIRCGKSTLLAHVEKNIKSYGSVQIFSFEKTFVQRNTNIALLFLISILGIILHDENHQAL